MPDLMGAAGVALIIASYLLLQLGKLQSVTLTYSAMNGIGALLILFSLLYEFNLPAFLIEFFWVLISILGVARSVRARRQRAVVSNREAPGAEGCGPVREGSETRDFESHK